MLHMCIEISNIYALLAIYHDLFNKSLLLQAFYFINPGDLCCILLLQSRLLLSTYMHARVIVMPHLL